MARGDGRGGYRKPPARSGPSGPGRFSKRTDGGVQPIRSPDMDQPGLQYGDRQMLTDAQRIARLPQAQRPSTARSAPPARLPEGAPLRSGGGLPDYLFQGPSARPNEPGTTGLSTGPGPGPEVLSSSQPAPDLREVTLRYFASTFGNQAAYRMLNEYIAERQANAAAAGGQSRANITSGIAGALEQTGTPRFPPGQQLAGAPA
jgi:hypothetical protein